MEPQDFLSAQRTVYLISRYINGEIDFAELQELESWKNASAANKELFEDLLDRENQKQAIKKMLHYDSRSSLLRLKKSMATQKEARFNQYLWIKIAAVVLSMVGLLTFLISKKDISQTAALKTRPQYIAPGSDKAILTLANGRKVAITPNTNNLLAQQTGVSVRNTKAGMVVYVPSGEDLAAVNQYNTIQTPRGGKYTIMLSDGTIVWLNAASSLNYPISFVGKKREVTLTGEAYFEVAKDKSKPFIVRAAGQQVTVLGTHFNINAYDDEPQVTTTLVEGSVQVTAGTNESLLKPGQQSLQANGHLNVKQADINVATAWKNGQLAFQRTDLKSVLRQVSRWYDVAIEYRGTVPEFTISGDISREADLSATLEILKLYEVQFVQQGRTLIILDHKPKR